MTLTKTWRGRFILLFLAAQLLMPLHYYLLRDDPHDERFAWRMFSPMRMTKCKPSFAVDGQPANIGTEFHEAWSELAERGRLHVIEEMGHHLCAKHPGQPVAVSLTCTYLDRSPATYAATDICTGPLR